MAVDENLRFVLELKDLFTEVFDKAAKHVDETAPKLQSKLGGLSKALAVVGAGVGIGAAVYGTWTAFKNKIADVTKEAEALQATLSNILGSKGAAKAVIEELANTDLTKVFKISDIDESYTNLANHGLRATLAQMQNIGEMGASTGKTVSFVADSILKGSEGNLRAIRALGIEVTKVKDKKKGIDDLTLSFRGQTTTIRNSSEAIRNYLLNLGSIPALQGSMARSSDTVVASENNLSNSLDKLWGGLSERFTPGVIHGKNQLSKMVATITSWVEIPLEKKINDQINVIRGLQTQITNTNTTEEKRKQLLQELHDLNPKLTEGIDAQAISYQKLADNIDRVTTSLAAQITKQQVMKRYAPILEQQANANIDINSADAAIAQILQKVDPKIASSTQLSRAEKEIEVIKKLREKGAVDGGKLTFGMIKNGANEVINEDGSIKPSYALTLLMASIKGRNQAISTLNSIRPKLKQMTDEEGALDNLIGKGSPIPTGNVPPFKKTNDSQIDKTGIASVSGGGQIKNITINIQNLVSGGVNVTTNTLKEGVSKAKDIVVEGLLTAVNDANLVGAN